jgi:NAD(P)-dependent dehydrogenase (short-subunit alcohol dehydrogenase family)
MKILLIGSGGTIGKAITALLSPTHLIIGVNHRTGDPRVDIADKASIEALFNHVGVVDAVICAAGAARFRPFAELTDDDYEFGLHNKLMGQVNVTRAAQGWLGKRGSITLTSGVLSHEPMPGSASVSLINAGVEGFGRAAALELRAGLRLNVVSPPWITETVHAMGLTIADTLPAATVARAYRDSVEGVVTGQVLDARRYA